jgi:hypothetical protein
MTDQRRSDTPTPRQGNGNSGNFANEDQKERGHRNEEAARRDAPSPKGDR